MKYTNIPPQIAAKLNESVARVRRILLVRGACATLAVFVASVLSIMAIDAMVTIYVSWVRWLLWACCIVATAAVAWFALVKPLRRKFTAAEIAALIERNHPELEERLSTVVELAQSGDLTSSSRLMEEITKDAVKDVQTVSPRKEFTGRTIKPRLVAAAIAVGILVLLFAAFPDATLRLATRALVPAAEVDNIYASSLKVTPGDKVILEGTPLALGLAVSEGFPSRAFVRTRPDGKGEAVERMVRVSEEGAEGPVIYSFSYPRVTKSFNYRISCGSALTRSYRVEVVPEPSYSGRVVEIRHPEYTRRDPDRYTNTAAIVGLEGSKITVSVKPSRPDVKGQLVLPGDVPVPGKESEGRLDFSFDLNKGVEGGWSSLVWDSHGFSNQIESASITIVKDMPPEVKIVSPEALDLKLPINGSLPIEYTIKDDFGLSRTTLEACIGAGAWQEHKSLDPEKTGDVSWGGSHVVHFAAGDFNNAAVVRFRVKVEDNLPPDLGGPGIAYTPEIMVTRSGAKDSKSLGRQSLDAQIEGAKKDMQNIVEHLRLAKRAFESARSNYGGAERNNWHRDEAIKASTRGKAEAQNAEGLLTDFIDGLLDSRLDTGAEMFKPVLDKHVTPVRQGSEDVFLMSRWNEKQEASNVLAKDTDEAIKAFEDAKRKFDILTKAAVELQKMQDLAEREKALAELAENGEIEAKKLAEEEQKLVEDAKDAIKDDLEKSLDKQIEKAKELEEKGKDLAKRQDEIEKKAAEAEKSGNEAEKKAAAEEEKKLAKDIADLAREADKLTKTIEEQAGTQEMDDNKTSEGAEKATAMAESAAESANEAAQKMEKGDMEGAKSDTKDVKDALAQAQQQLSEAQEKMAAKNQEFAQNASDLNDMVKSMEDAAQAAQAAAEAQEAADAQRQAEGDNQNSDGQQSDQQGENQQGENQQGENQQGENQQGENQQGDWQKGDQQQGENQQGQQQQGEQQQGQQQQGEQQQGQQQQGQQQQGEQQQGQQQQGEQQQGQQQQGQQQQGPQQQGPEQQAMQNAAQKAQQAAQKMQNHANEQARQNNMPMDQFESESSESDSASESSSEGGEHTESGKPSKSSKSSKHSDKGKPKKEKPAKHINPMDEGDDEDWFKMKSESGSGAEDDSLDDVPSEYRGLVRDYFKALNEGGKK